MIDPYFSCDASRPDSVCALFMTNSSALNHDLAIPLKLSYNEMNDPNYPQEVVQEFVSCIMIVSSSLFEPKNEVFRSLMRISRRYE